MSLTAAMPAACAPLVTKRRTYAIEHVCHGFPDSMPNGASPCPLRISSKMSGHDDVIARVDQFDAWRVIVTGHVFSIGSINN